MLNKLLTVVVVCYDPYIDASELNYYFLQKNWNNCSVDVLYVSSNMIVDGKFRTIQTNGDISFYGRLASALKHVHTKYVLVLLDDYLVNKHVNESLLLDNVKFMEQQSIHYCELFTYFHTPRGKFVGKQFKKINDKRKYRLTFQPSIFTVDILKDLICFEPQTPWDAELCFMNSHFIKYDAYFSSNKSFSIINYIEKGKVTRKAFRLLKKEGRWKHQRQVRTRFEEFKSWFVNSFSFFVPEKIKKHLKGESKIFK